MVAAWQHPWLRIERALRAVLGDRMICGASDERDSALAAVRRPGGASMTDQRIERAGWFN